MSQGKQKKSKLRRTECLDFDSKSYYPYRYFGNRPLRLKKGMGIWNFLKPAGYVITAPRPFKNVRNFRFL
jgi:hypothetical protein